MEEVFDPSKLDTLIEGGIAFLMIAIPKVLLAIILYFIGKYIIKIVRIGTSKIYVKYEIEPSLASFLSSFLNGILYILLILAILSTLGVEVTAFIAVLGAAGLAVGLALQGSLANFAGGVLILAFKPFRVGEIIDAQGTLGVVEKIDILYTTIRNYDNKVVTIPNGILANNNIVNLSKKQSRRVEMSVRVALGSDMKHVRKVILDTLARDARIHKEPAPVVLVTNFGESALELSVRCWTDTDNLWPVFWESLEKINEAFVGADIKIPFPHRDVRHTLPEGKLLVETTQNANNVSET